MPEEIMSKFAHMIVQGNIEAEEILKHIEIDHDNLDNWLGWLDELDDFSCKSVDFSNFPKTLLFYGTEDHVVNYKQAQLFADKIADKICLIPNVKLRFVQIRAPSWITKRRNALHCVT